MFGVRPENTSETPLESQAVATLEAPVEITEMMGEETYVHLRLSDHMFISRIKTAFGAEVGRALKVHLDLAKAKLFDPETEEVL